MKCTPSELPKPGKPLRSLDLSHRQDRHQPLHSFRASDLAHTPYHLVERPGHSRHSFLCGARTAICAQAHLVQWNKWDILKWLWNLHLPCCWHAWSGKTVSSAPISQPIMLYGEAVVRAGRIIRGGSGQKAWRGNPTSFANTAAA